MIQSFFKILVASIKMRSRLAGQNLAGIAQSLDGEYELVASSRRSRTLFHEGDYLHLIRRLPSAFSVLFFSPTMFDC